ncbi:MAG: hypothetical protein IJT23_03415 [Clostridia bacterium]|nr:hypothetical protein [Clostridia bacterium]
MNKIFVASAVENIYRAYTKEQIGGCKVLSCEEFIENFNQYRDLEYIFSTWDAPILSEEQIEKYLPNLKALFYAGGSAVYFAAPYLNKNVRVFGGWVANAVPVAEFAVAQIILANKGYFHGIAQYKKYGYKTSFEMSNSFDGNFKSNIGILGLGAISRHVIALLNQYDVNIYVWSNSMTDAEAKRLNVRKAKTLDEVFEKCDVISNHLAKREELRGILNYSLFSKMKKTGAFVNTGRGTEVNEADLVRAMKEEPLRMALLDVTYPEPTAEDSPLWTAENIIISPHRAGAYTKEILRLGEYMFDEYRRVVNGEETKYEITKDMVKILAQR